VEKYTGKIIYVFVSIFIQSLFRMLSLKLAAWRINVTETALHEVEQPWSVMRHKTRNGADTELLKIGLNRAIK